MKQTAVEWLVEQMLVCNYINKKQYDNCRSWLLQQAKELEKEQQGYSEEELLNLLTHFAVEIQRQNKKGQYPIEIKGWFERNKEQFKNK